MGFDPSKDSFNDTGNIKWQDQVKAFGIFFCTNAIKRQQHNWYKIGIKDSFQGKIQVIKSLILPTFTYMFKSCYVPNEIIKQIDTKCFFLISCGTVNVNKLNRISQMKYKNHK